MDVLDEKVVPRPCGSDAERLRLPCHSVVHTCFKCGIGLLLAKVRLVRRRGRDGRRHQKHTLRAPEGVHQPYFVSHFKWHGHKLRALSRQALRFRGVDPAGECADAITPALQQGVRSAAALLAPARLRW